MRLERLKRWHWVGIGMVIGLALSYSRASDKKALGRSLDQSGFEELLRSHPVNGHAPVRALRVHAPEGGTSLVTGQRLIPLAGGRWQYVPFSFFAPVPYATNASDLPKSSHDTVVQYLDHLRRNNPNARYVYAWWDAPHLVWLVWTIGAVVVIGVAWPTVLHALLRAPDVHGADEPKTLPQGRRMAEESRGVKRASGEQAAQLAGAIALFEERLGELAPATNAEVARAPQEDRAVTRPLDAPSLEPPVETEHTVEKSFGGEFYPTVVHGGAEPRSDH